MPPKCRHIGHDEGMGRAAQWLPHRGRLAWHCVFPPLCWPPRSCCRNRRRQRSSRSRSSPPTMPSRSSASRSRARPWSAASARPATRSTARSEAPVLPHSSTARPPGPPFPARSARAGVSPDSYSVDYVYGKKTKKTSLQFAKGNVVKIANSPPLPPRRAGLGAGRRQGTARRRRSDQRDADRGEGCAFRLRPHHQGVRRRDPGRSGAQLRRYRAGLDRRATRSRRSPAGGVSSRSPAIIAATSRSSICRPKARSC